MSVQYLMRVSIVVALAMILSACGGGGSTGSGGNNPVPVTGVFVDSVVQGLDYNTPLLSGITNADGEFEYVPSESVTFSIGNIILGRGLGLDVLTPVDLVLQASDETNPIVTNIARLLLTLDDDQIPDNGITITPALRTAAQSGTFNNVSIDQITTDSELQDLVDQLTAAVTAGSGSVGTATRTLVSSQFAQDHLRSTLLALDTTPPDVTITSGPPDPSNSLTATFEFSSNEIATTYTCALDDEPLDTCISPQDYPSLTSGPHNFLVRAMDLAGNTADATWTWTVDLTLDVTITSGPDGPTNDTSASFEFSANLPATLTCSLDGDPLTPCTSPQDYAGLAEGTHIFQVQATEDSTNLTADATRTWTVDLIPPDITITSGPVGPTTATSATFEFTSTDPTAVFTCALDAVNASDFAPCTSPVTYQDLFNGAHQFQVSATDPAGNSTGTSQSWTVNDETPPDNASVVINSGDATTESATVTLALAASDAGSGVNGYCILDNATGIAPATPSAGDACFNDVVPAVIDYSNSLPYTYTGSYTPGDTITVFVWYRDDAGNVTASPAVDDIDLVDVTLPTVDSMIIDPPVAPDDTLPNSQAATYTLLSDRITVELEASDNLGVAGYYVSEHNATDPNNISPPVLEPLPSEIISVPEATGPTIFAHPLVQGPYSIGDTLQMCAWVKDGVEQISSAKCDTITYGVDWESGIGTWTKDNNVWQIGPFGVSEPFNGSCFGGDPETLCAGTGQSGDFPPVTNGRLISPTIVLPTVTGATTIHLSFQNAYEYAILSGATGHGQIQVQVFNNTISDFDPPVDVGPAVVGVSPDWEPRDVDLTAYAGDKVRLVFLHVAQDQTSPPQTPGPTYQTSAGWIIDNVQIVIVP